MKLVVLGARADGQAHLVLDAVEERGEHEIVAFADETPDLWGKSIFGLPVIGPPHKIVDQIDELEIGGAFIAIGHSRARARLAESCRAFNLELPTIIHPSAQVSRYTRIGEGVFLGQGVQILAGAVVGDLALINAGTVVSHHVQVGPATTVGPNSTLAGRASTGAFVLLGASCTVLPDVVVGEGAVVGASALATRDVPAGVTVIGVPAKPLGTESRKRSGLL